MVEIPARTLRSTLWQARRALTRLTCLTTPMAARAVEYDAYLDEVCSEAQAWADRRAALLEAAPRPFSLSLKAAGDSHV